MQTGDGYLLGVHRLCSRKRGEEGMRVNAGRGSLQKRVVYLHHGLLMNSEVWVSLTEKERCLPFMLVERGYDVWVGYIRSTSYADKTDDPSWEIIVAINTRRSLFAFPQLPMSSGTSPWTNLPSMIYQTASITFSQLRRRHPYLMLASPRAPLRPSRRCPSILLLMTRLTSSLVWPQPCRLPVFETESSTPW